MKKKGSIMDLPYIALVIFMTAIVFVAGWMIFSKVNDSLQAKDDFSTVGKSIMQESSDRYVGLMDGVFLTLLIGFYLGSLILASQIDASPLFFIVSLVIFGVLILLTAVFGNAFYTFADNAEISTYASAFVIIPFIMNNFVQTFVVLGFGLAGVMYAKTRS